METTSRRDAFWEHCRNNLGIARLLVQERRPESLIATACRMAVETACRAVQEHEGQGWDGDTGAFFDRLGDQFEPFDVEEGMGGPSRLAAAESAVARVAAHLRRLAPERSWGF
jgi:hypothetical protein